MLQSKHCSGDDNNTVTILCPKVYPLTVFSNAYFEPVQTQTETA